MNQYVSKTLFMAAAKRRNPSLWQEYDSLKQSEWLNKQQLIKLQMENARKFFTFVEKNSPYYKKAFSERGFLAENFSSLNDLKKLPLITKNQLVEHNHAIHADAEFNKTFLAKTSGTSGSALTFRKNEQWDSINRANMFRSYDWYDVKPWQRHGYLWGYNITPAQSAKIKLLDMAQNRFRLFCYDKQAINLFSEKLLAASFLAGYSSMIYEVAKNINELGLDKPVLNMVKGTSEMILDSYQAAVQQAFDCKIVSEYGAAESGLIAFECPHGSMHINMEHVIVEVDVDGYIVVTNLASYSFPIIRYQLGDAITLSDEPCLCGRAHPVIKEVMGRRGATVYGVNTNFPALIFYYVFKNLATEKSLILNYKASQQERAKVDIQIEGLHNSRYEAVVMAELAKYFKNEICFQLTFVNAFEPKRKKFQYFESLYGH